MSWSRLLVALAALAVACLAVAQLERQRAGLAFTEFRAGTTPATLTARPGADGPLVVIAHGFAGSRQMMQGYALTLARAGYRAVSFDFEGHGRNPVPMSGDVTAIDGTTALLVAETARVLAAARTLTGEDGPAALIGHSMASDIVVRAALADPTIVAVVALSMYSEAVTADAPARLLIVTGQGEPFLRQAALDALRLVDPKADEGMTVTRGAVTRRAVVAPHVEHVGILHSRTALREARAWLDTAFGRQGAGPVTAPAPWMLALLGAILALGWPLAALIGPRRVPDPAPLPRRAFLVAILLPAVAAPLALSLVRTQVLPVLVADYLVMHLGLYGALQMLVLWRAGLRPAWGPLWPGLALAAWGIGVFGLALDRYGASFTPIPARLWLIAAMGLGTVPFMLADSLLLRGRRTPVWRTLAARGAVLGSLGAAVALDVERLFFLVIVLPVIVLFFVIFGLLGRWTAERAGPVPAGLGLGLILAWALGVSFPMFTA